MVLKLKIDIVDLENFNKCAYPVISENPYILSILSNSYTEPFINNDDDDDDRDIEIKRLFSDTYIFLDIIDIDGFIDLVENKRLFTCDVNQESASYLKQYLDVKYEIEKYNEGYILSNINKNYNFLKLKTLSKLPLSIFEKYPDKFNWVNISYLELPESYIKHNMKYLEQSIIGTKILSDNFILNNYTHLDIPEVIENNFSLLLRRNLSINELLS